MFINYSIPLRSANPEEVNLIKKKKLIFISIDKKREEEFTLGLKIKNSYIIEGKILLWMHTLFKMMPETQKVQRKFGAYSLPMK